MHSHYPDRIIVKRRAIRGLALLIIFVMVVDTIPRSWTWLARPKRMLSWLLYPVGLGQGEWPLFAPDPVINNGWLTAELRAADGTVSQWDSPYWSEVSGPQKFVRFRHVNYYNRLPLPYNRAALDDFLDYLGRRASKPTASVKLYNNQLHLQMPEDGSLPPRDEIQWMFSSEVIARRGVQP